MIKMVRFCDKRIHIMKDGQMSGEEILLFFQQGNEDDVIQIVDEYGNHLGIKTYDSVLRFGTDYICTDVLRPGKDFWDEAEKLFEQKPYELIPVMRQEIDMISFCYNDSENYSPYIYTLEAMERAEEIPVFFPEIFHGIHQIMIMDINEIAYRLYKILKQKNFPVCVIGDKWEWFGIVPFEGYADYPDYKRLYIYAEGNNLIRVDNRKLKSRYGCVYNQFLFLRDMGIKNYSMIKARELVRLAKKGVNVCECVLPETASMPYMTSGELNSTKLDNIITKYVENPEILSEEMIQNLYDAYGKENCEYLREKGSSFDDYDTVLYNGSEVKSISTKYTGKRIYLIGPCITMGFGVRKEYSLMAALQELAGSEYQVVAVPIRHLGFDIWQRQICRLPVRSQDIVIAIDSRELWTDAAKSSECADGVLNKLVTLDITPVFDHRERRTWIHQQPIHLNREGNFAVAEYIYDNYMKDTIRHDREGLQNNIYLQTGDIVDESSKSRIKEYTDGIKRFCCEENDVIGAIVMNCNPFTLGHQYLIEYAAGQVDYLYIFVVEEDRSCFPFMQRFRMVQNGTNHLNNVKVVSSGAFVLSYNTMPIYFEKAIKQEAQVDASSDIEIFARYIAPPLNIKYRFVGEEPVDKVTRQYNEQMKEILPLFDITFCEIPRKMLHGNIISASQVRRCMQENKWEEVKELVPASTLEICLDGSSCGEEKASQIKQKGGT